MSISKNQVIHFILILLFIAEIDYSFRQHEHKTLDGDMALITAPSKFYTTILDEPFGLKASIHHEKYAGSNRYYIHKAMVIYYKKVYPVFSSFFTDKVDFLYKFTGLFQLIIQLFIILLLVYYSVKLEVINRTKILFLILLISSLFQTHGFSNSIGVIDHSVTYTFFYALPLFAFMVFLLPYLHWNIENKSVYVKIICALFWIPFAFILSMSGAIIPPLGFMIAGVILLYIIRIAFKKYQILHNQSQRYKVIPFFSIITLSVFLLCCMYSYYVGLYNTENSLFVPLIFRYEKLIEGLKLYFIQDVSFLLIGILLLVNFYLIQRSKIKIPFYVWLMLVMSVSFVLLLPLGGYRSYRPNIIRNDTFLPVTLMLFYFIARSTTVILSRTKFSKMYVVFLCIVMLIFTYADKPNFNEDYCQRMQIKKLKHSKEKITSLSSDCPILTWDCTSDTQWTIDGSKMLYYWNITDSVRIYKHAN
jgi:hypothetical protein